MRRVICSCSVAVAIATAWPAVRPPGALADKRCAAFTSSDGYRIPVYVRGTSCRTGTRVLRKFLPRGGTNTRILGWRCTSGTGGTFCRRGHDRVQTSRL
jgi:hypothetical protein